MSFRHCIDFLQVVYFSETLVKANFPCSYGQFRTWISWVGPLQ